MSAVNVHYISIRSENKTLTQLERHGKVLLETFNILELLAFLKAHKLRIASINYESI